MVEYYVIEKGGPGSGNYGHAGRPGMVGGSAPSKGGGKGGKSGGASSGKKSGGGRRRRRKRGVKQLRSGKDWARAVFGKSKHTPSERRAGRWLAKAARATKREESYQRQLSKIAAGEHLYRVFDEYKRGMGGLTDDELARDRRRFKRNARRMARLEKEDGRGIAYSGYAHNKGMAEMIDEELERRAKAAREKELAEYEAERERANAPATGVGVDRLRRNDGKEIRELLDLAGPKGLFRSELWAFGSWRGERVLGGILTDGRTTFFSNGYTALQVDDPTREPLPSTLYVDGDDAEKLVRGKVDAEEVSIKNGAQEPGEAISGVLNNGHVGASGEIDGSKLVTMAKKYRRDRGVDRIVVQVDKGGTIWAMPGKQESATGRIIGNREQRVKLGKVDKRPVREDAMAFPKEMIGTLMNGMGGSAMQLSMVTSSSAHGETGALYVEREESGKRYQGMVAKVNREIVYADGESDR